MTDDKLTPDLDDVLQEEAAPARLTPIPVVVEGPTRTQQLPTRSPGMATYELEDTPLRVLQDDPRRSRAVLQAHGGTVILATSQAACRHAGAKIGAGPLLSLSTSGEVWARAADASGTDPVELTVINEQWAD